MSVGTLGVGRKMHVQPGNETTYVTHTQVFLVFFRVQG